ncbi:unnamed protein product [Spirodela intermedia]|uniref:Uncharacterized protein n=1 Tax=Spirodela intermedia TaxID=51605 RepID=A0A7I8K545_SPIIN|nr:unnamed protein product [Spirodela intermedia]CAA7391766.1 unnamed protein product [Spirodela intermedia]
MGCRVISGGYHSTERKNGDLRLSDGCHLTERSWMEEVATHLLADRPLSDDGLFVNQLEIRLATSDVEGEWRTCAPSIQAKPSRSSSCSWLLSD